MNKRNAFYTEIRNLMIPIAFQNLMMTLVSATDALVLARVDQYSVAAVSLAAEINFIMNLFLGAIIGGIGIMVSQYYGKGDHRTVKNLMGMSLRYNVAISFLFFLAARFAPGFLMRVYTSDTRLIQIGVGYLKIASWSYLLSAISQCYLCIMKITGGAKVSAGIAATVAVVDVLADLFLVYGMKMGASGTAISTVAVCLVELVSVILYSHRREKIYPSFTNLLYFSKELELDFRKLSFPVLAGGLVWGVGYSLSAAVMGHISADASAAYAISNLVRTVFTCFIRGLGNGAGIIVGKNLGSGNLDLAKQNGTDLAKTSIVCGLFSGLALLLLGPFVFQFFILTDSAKVYLGKMIPVASVYLIAKSVCVTMISGVFSAGGDTHFDAEITAITMWLIALPLGFLSAFVFRFPVVITYTALCLDEFTKALFVYPRFKKYLWLKNLTRDLK